MLVHLRWIFQQDLPECDLVTDGTNNAVQRNEQQMITNRLTGLNRSFKAATAGVVMLLVITGCGAQESSSPNASTQATVNAQLQPVLDALTAWRQSAFPEDLAPADVHAALEKRLVALDQLDKASVQWAAYLSTTSEVTANPQVGQSMTDLSTALTQYAHTVEPGMQFLKKCLPADPTKKQLKTCEAQLNKKYGPQVSQAENSLQTALAQLTIAAYVTESPSASPS